MSVSLSADSLAALVAALRGAGCVFAEDEALLLTSSASTPDDLAAMVDRRLAGRPLEHIVGWVEFGGHRMVVDPGVFVPRRRSELLVRRAVELVRRDRAGDALLVVDLCCGCGAVGAALARALVDVELVAVDSDPVAVRCALRNVDAVGGRVYQGDLYQPLPGALRGRVDVVLAVAPYVPTEARELLPPEARLHEPSTALDGGQDGLDVVRRIIAGAPDWLAPGGHLLLETGEGQIPEVTGALAQHGLIPSVARTEEPTATVVVGTSRAEPDGE
jgi:release factor glutamine methyltransferase